MPNTSFFLKKDRTSQLAKLTFSFDYSEDFGFVMPPFPFIPPKANLYPTGHDAIDGKILRDAFSPLVGKCWGRAVSGLDHSKQGAFSLEGKPIWGDCLIRSSTGSALGERYCTPSHQMGGTQSFVYLSGYEAVFYDLPETLTLNSPAMLAGNWGQVRWAMLILPKPLLSSYERRNAHVLRDAFGTNWRTHGELDLGRVSIPFPFNCKDITLKDVAVFNYPNVKCDFELGSDWTLAYFLLTDSYHSTLVECPEVEGKFPLMFDVSTHQNHVNLFSVCSRLLQSGKDKGLWDFGGLPLGDTGPVSQNRTALLKSFSGEGIQEDVLLTPAEPSKIEPPVGLRQLPNPPAGYGYVCDLTGLLYMTDRSQKMVFSPFQVFDLRAMRSRLAELDEGLSHHDPDESSTDSREAADLKDQIELVEELFEHQEKVLKGTLFNYQMGRSS